jgi:hypothetical protein
LNVAAPYLLLEELVSRPGGDIQSLLLLAGRNIADHERR